MRSPAAALLSLACLAACTSVPPAGATDPQLAWRDLQRERMARLLQPRDPVAALAALRAQDPRAQQPAPRRYIDQVEPLGVGPRRILGDDGSVLVRLDAGVGSMALKVPGSVLDDRAGAASVRLSIDAASQTERGASLRLRAAASDDDLLANARISDGAAPALATATLRSFDAFPHARFDTCADGTFLLPVRAGLFVDRFELDHHDAGLERSWLSVGPRLVLEPRWRLCGDARHGLAAKGSFGGDFGVTWFGEKWHGGQDRDVTVRGALGAGAGLEYTCERLSVELGYEFDQAWFGGIDTELYQDHSRTEAVQQRWFLGFGARF